jgi:hypothetical protein
VAPQLLLAAAVIVSPRGDGLELARKVVVDDGTTAAPTPDARRIIYLNRHGITLTPGADDSRIGRSSLVSSAITIPPWDASEALWSKTVSCLRAMYARFDVEITDVDPGAAPHVEAVFGGSPTLLGFGERVAGIAPFSTRCRTIENAIVLTFTDALPDVAQVPCEIMAQEIGHSYGLDHELLGSDPMTYLPFDGMRSFQDQLVSCGEWEPRACGAPGYAACSEMQSSVALLTERLGRAGEGDHVPPIVAITSPAAGDSVPAGFQVTAEINDDVRPRVATLAVDGVVVDTLTAAPWVFSTSQATPSGSYRLTVTATDGANERSDTIDVDVEAAANQGGGNAPLVGCNATPGSLPGLLAVLLSLVGMRERRPRRRQGLR